ncbi:hypothetical protein [Humibacillus xanthopallidus]|uniref:Uncharacterized protein n=1 Tax=Humibacillus xanthopallidus TaxID=412689 RepID=A0A543HWH8_9MICO|nr:hypothetical protein [Humibacillus xanthopallidus]TQM62589.1 hypothetical protein FBY41_2625 [Humibacillus xanthopallidus]
MTRLTNRQATSDTITHRPPTRLLPPELATLVAELEAIDGKAGAAATQRGNLIRDWSSLLVEAQRADARAAAVAAREGTTTVATPHADALGKRLAQAKADEAALTTARHDVINDLQAARDALDRRASAKRATTAADALAKAARALTAALDEAAEATAMHDWITGGSYDPSTILDARALSPEIASSSYTPIPINAHRLIDAVAHLTAQESAHA